MYKPKYCKELQVHMSQGYSFQSFAGKIGVCVDTINGWAQIKPEFSYARAAGNAQRLLYNEQLLDSFSSGKSLGNAAAIIFKMKNMGSGLAWTDKTEVDVTTTEVVKTIPRFGER